MCGRYASLTPPTALAEMFRVTDVKAEQLPLRYNVAPTLDVYAVAERRPRSAGETPVRQLGAFRWGLVPSWAEDPSIAARLINARAETVATKPAFRDALLRRRCIIPADAFYEWQLTPTPDGRMSKAKAPKVPHAIRHRDGSPMAFAGLWELWRPPHDDQGLLRTCAIVTTSANQAIAPIHHRMPVVLPPDSWDEWLDPRHHDLHSLQSLLVPAPGDNFEIYPVSTLVNSANNDGPELLLPALHGEGAEMIENDGAPERLQFG